MDRLRTIIILGAGASYCYEDGNSNFPTQDNIIGRLFVGIDTSSGEGAPTVVYPNGLKHSFPLGQYLREKFNIADDQSKTMSKTDFWTILQKRGYTLETLYSELEQDVKRAGNGRWVVEDFEAIIRTSVTEPNSHRELSRICKFHKMLCEALEPGDSIINFNWDTLMADALLFHSHFWFPTTGFGLGNIFPLMRVGQKRQEVNSLVELYHVHGSICLCEMLEQKESQGKVVIYVGPKAYSQGNALQYLAGDNTGKEEENRKLTKENYDEEFRKFTLGYIYYDKHWFKPIFVPPSKYKRDSNYWYSNIMRRNIYSRLPKVQQIIIIGYSFPDADMDYLKDLFLSKIINPELKLTIVNPSNDNETFRPKVKAIFPSLKSEPDYSCKDFREFCRKLPTSYFHVS